MIFKQHYEKLTSENISNHLIHIRHELHKHPELSLEEINTTALLKKECEKLNCAFLKELSPTGLIGCIKGTDATRPPIALRADIDALPIQEESNIDYKSIIPGKMHACGHDMHTTWLLATLYLLNEHPAKQDVIFIFQPAEEISAGAKIVLNTPYLNNVTEIYAGHVDLNYEVGQFVVHDGYISATSTIYTVTLTGKSSHIARPHEGISPLPALAEIITLINTITQSAPQQDEALIVGIGNVHAGTANNISPETATLEGSIRSLSQKNQDYIINTLKTESTNIAKKYQISVDIAFTPSSPAILNHPTTNKRAKNCIRKQFSNNALTTLKQVNLASEDFGYYAKKIPATFLRIGSRHKNGEIIPAHNPKFLVDDDTIFAAGLAFFSICQND